MPPVKKAKAKSAPPAEANETVQKTVISGQLEKKLNNRRNRKFKSNRGVVLVKNLPKGFFEEQLKKYFQQFGNVTRLRLARSTHTGGSKAFAFIEFEYPEVAQVAAETMSNYLMFKKVVKAAYIPPEKQQYDYFKSSVRKVKNKAGKDIFVSHATRLMQQNVNKQNNWSDDAFQKRTVAQLKKVDKLKKKYAHLGIDFSKILIEPKKLSADDEQKQTETNIDDTNAGNSTSQTGIKRKQSTKSEKVNAVKIKKSQTNKKEIELADLLSNTINDDSEDEDYVAVPNSDESADELTDASSDEDNDIIPTESSDEGEDEIKQKVIPKSLKTKNIRTFEAKSNIEKLIKRKPLAGGIQKNPKKSAKKPSLSKAKNTMQLAAAKQLVKSLPKGKISTNIKATSKKQKKQKS